MEQQSNGFGGVLLFRSMQMSLDEVEEKQPVDIVDTTGEEDQQYRSADATIALCGDERSRIADCRDHQKIRLGARNAAKDKSADGQSAHGQYRRIEVERELTKGERHSENTGKPHADDDAVKTDSPDLPVEIDGIEIHPRLAKGIATGRNPGNGQEHRGHGNIYRLREEDQLDEGVDGQWHSDQGANARYLTKGF